MAAISKGNSTSGSGSSISREMDLGVSAFTRWAMIASRAAFLWSARTQIQGAAGVEVRVSISSRAWL
jgi:hypothetical protein